MSNNGAGIPADVRPRLFEPFFTTKDLGEGSGLGLAAALGVVRLERGELQLGHTSEAGTTMVRVLPLAQDTARGRRLTIARYHDAPALSSR